MKFTDILEKETAKLLEMQINHPFLQGMSDGSLDMEKFKFYAKQDYLYLKTYDKLWALAIAKCDDLEMLKKLVQLLNYTLKFEIALTKYYASKLGVTMKDLEEEELAPTTQAYVDFELSTALYGDLADTLVAVAPCIIGYNAIFTKLRSRGMPKGSPIYTKSIKDYSGARSTALVKNLKEMINKLAEKKTPAGREKMKKIYQIAARYEYLFWDQAYRLEKWPDEK